MTYFVTPTNSPPVPGTSFQPGVFAAPSGHPSGFQVILNGHPYVLPDNGGNIAGLNFGISVDGHLYIMASSLYENGIQIFSDQDGRIYLSTGKEYRVGGRTFTIQSTASNPAADSSPILPPIFGPQPPAYQGGGLLVSTLNSIHHNPHYSPEVQQIIDLIIENGGEDPLPALQALASLLEDPNFTPELLGPVITFLNNTEESPIFIFQALSSLLSNPNYSPEVRDLAGYILENTGEGALIIIEGLTFALEDPHYTPEILTLFRNIAAYCRTSPEFIILYLIPSLSAQNFDPGLIRFVNRIIENFGSLSPVNFSGGIQALLAHPHFNDLLEQFNAFIDGVRENPAQAFQILLEINNDPEIRNIFLGLFSIEDGVQAGGLTGALDANPAIHNSAPLITANLEAARNLALSLGLPPEDQNFVTYLNFAYALATVGEEATRRLYEQFGVCYFMRYTPATLQAVAANSEPNPQDTRPLCLVVFNRNDYNGAFYTSGTVLESLTSHYRVLIVEVDSEISFAQKVTQVAGTYGLIDAVVIGGHGDPQSIQLGSVEDLGEEARLDINDEALFSGLRENFAPNLTSIFISCSTGEYEAGVNEKSIAGFINSYWGGRAFAPLTPENIVAFKYGPQGIESVLYWNDDTQEFLFPAQKKT